MQLRKEAAGERYSGASRRAVHGDWDYWSAVLFAFIYSDFTAICILHIYAFFGIVVVEQIRKKKKRKSR